MRHVRHNKTGPLCHPGLDNRLPGPFDHLRGHVHPGDAAAVRTRRPARITLMPPPQLTSTTTSPAATPANSTGLPQPRESLRAASRDARQFLTAVEAVIDGETHLRRLRLAFRNRTMMFHPMHAHGHTFALANSGAQGHRHRPTGANARVRPPGRQPGPVRDPLPQHLPRRSRHDDQPVLPKLRTQMNRRLHSDQTPTADAPETAPAREGLLDTAKASARSVDTNRRGEENHER